MRSWLAGATALLALLLVPGCAAPAPGSGSAPGSGKPAYPTVSAPVTVRRTGGFAGVDQVLVVRPDGRWRWTPGRHGGGPRSGRLDPATRRALARLAGRIRSSGPVPGQRSAGPRCADGFHYSVRVGTASAAWYDCDGDPPRPAVDLLALLSGSTPL